MFRRLARKILLNDRNNRALHNWLVLIWMRKGDDDSYQQKCKRIHRLFISVYHSFSGSEEVSNGESKTSME